MNLDKFRRSFHSKVLSKANELQPLTHIWGTNSPLIQHTINLAVSCLEDGEAYFEVGCLYGSSLAAACVNNEDKYKYAWDIKYEKNAFEVINNQANRIKAHEGDFFEENPRLPLEEFIKRPVGVYYYDADHSHEATLKALCKIIPHLSDNALIIMDDLEYGSVYNSWRKFAREHSGNFTVVHEFWTPDKFIACTKGYKDEWWDACGIMEYEKEFKEEDEDVANRSVQIWHGMGEYKDRHGTLHPREFKYIHGKEEQRA